MLQRSRIARSSTWPCSPSSAGRSSSASGIGAGASGAEARIRITSRRAASSRVPDATLRSRSRCQSGRPFDHSWIRFCRSIRRFSQPGRAVRLRILYANMRSRVRAIPRQAAHCNRLLRDARRDRLAAGSEAWARGLVQFDRATGRTRVPRYRPRADRRSRRSRRTWCDGGPRTTKLSTERGDIELNKAHRSFRA